MTDESFVIRRATVADAPTLAAQRVWMFRDMKSLDPSLEDVLLEAGTDQMREAMSSGDYVAWVLCPDGEPDHIIGGGGVQLRQLFPRPDVGGKRILIGREGIVLNVFVERAFRRRGLARRIMKEILDWVPTSDIVRLVLHASDEGRRLYEGLGFAPTTEMRYSRPIR